MFNLSDKVKHYFHEANSMGELDLTKPENVMVEVITPDAYTHLQLFIELSNNKKNIKNIKFRALGCPSAIACLAFISEYLREKPILESQKVTAKFLIRELELSKERYSVAVLAEDLMHQLARIS